MKFLHNWIKTVWFITKLLIVVVIPIYISASLPLWGALIIYLLWISAIVAYAEMEFNEWKNEYIKKQKEDKNVNTK